MTTKQKIIDKAIEIGFEDIGFTGIEPFTSQLGFLEKSDYSWPKRIGLDLEKFIHPTEIMSDSKSIIVLIYRYLKSNIPASLTGHFGRCYLNDDRITKDGLALKIKEFRNYLKENGINTKLTPASPDKLAAARAGIGTFGKNCLLYASKSALKSSFIYPIIIATDAELEPDTPNIKTDCPSWCRNVCIAACPTKALQGEGRINLERCISYLGYFGAELTPLELREPMGMYIYGCDRCQNVCPRNQPILASVMPEDSRITEMSKTFTLEKLLTMDKEYFKKFIWPNMFYMSEDFIWKWKMNSARAMGNSLDKKYIPYLIDAIKNEDDERVKSMAAWSLGRIGGDESISALKSFNNEYSGIVKNEIDMALESFSKN
jgi:epoxyqueuosine reductase